MEIFLVSMGLLEKGINAPFASCKAAAARKGRADLILRNKLLNRRKVVFLSFMCMFLSVSGLYT